jgi:hypothetical protein
VDRGDRGDIVAPFLRDGFVRIADAFPGDWAAEARRLLWPQTGCAPDDPATWTRPVIRLGDQADPVFAAAANTERLRAAYDELVGPRRWVRRRSLGTFPIRFPSPAPPGDDGWHVDASFAGDDQTNMLHWRVNVASRGRALLMLFLFSDVGPDDAPTRIRVGSHHTVAQVLAPHGAAGLTMLETSQQAESLTRDHDVALATGAAGDVYLCHPFLLHAAQPHRGQQPRFLAQPPLSPRHHFRPTRGTSPVEQAIRAAISPE